LRLQQLHVVGVLQGKELDALGGNGHGDLGESLAVGLRVLGHAAKKVHQGVENPLVAAHTNIGFLAGIHARCAVLVLGWIKVLERLKGFGKKLHMQAQVGAQIHHAAMAADQVIVAVGPHQGIGGDGELAVFFLLHQLGLPAPFGTDQAVLSVSDLHLLVFPDGLIQLIDQGKLLGISPCL